jgi:ABC-type glycerol-3-phosphate transport system substrate-binding protein
MRVCIAIGMMAAALVVAGCGGSDEPEKKEEVMKVEDTVFGPLVGTPKKVEDRVNSSIDAHREDLDRRLQEDEGASAEEPPAD